MTSMDVEFQVVDLNSNSITIDRDPDSPQTDDREGKLKEWAIAMILGLTCLFVRLVIEAFLAESRGLQAGLAVCGTLTGFGLFVLLSAGLMQPEAFLLRGKEK